MNLPSVIHQSHSKSHAIMNQPMSKKQLEETERLRPLSQKKVDILRRLIDEASKSEMRTKHAAAIVKSGKIRTIGHNSYRNSIGGNRVSSTHAEISALYKWLKIGDKSTVDLWVIRINSEDELMNSSPCLSCVFALKKYNIRNIYYSNPYGDENEKGPIVRVNINKMDLAETHVSRYQMHYGIFSSWNLGRKWRMG